jgi:hypothetical protein
VARLVGDPLNRELGQTGFVEAKPGAGGAIAVNDLLQSPHDGQTLLVGVSSLVSEIPHAVKLKIDMQQSLRPIAELARSGLVLVANPSFPANNLEELIAYVKANPGKVSYASYSPGTLSHALGLLLNKEAGLDLTHVGYKGSTPALTDVMGNHVPLVFDGIGTSLPLIKSGKIKAIAVSTSKRSPVLPDVPTFTQLGHPKLEGSRWNGSLVHARRAGSRAVARARGHAEGPDSAGGARSLPRAGLRGSRTAKRRRHRRGPEGRLRPPRRRAAVDRIQAGVEKVSITASSSTGRSLYRHDRRSQSEGFLRGRRSRGLVAGRCDVRVSGAPRLGPLPVRVRSQLS